MIEFTVIEKSDKNGKASCCNKNLVREVSKPNLLQVVTQTKTSTRKRANQN